MKGYTEKNYKRINRAGYVIFRFKNICLCRLYSKGNLKGYFEDLYVFLVELIANVAVLITSPFRSILLMYKFIPKFRLIKKDPPEINDYDIEVL